MMAAASSVVNLRQWDSARVHEAVERILAKRHSGALEMHLRVNRTLLEHHTERQQEDAEDRDAAKLIRICRSEDATDLIATEKRFCSCMAGASAVSSM